jgi:hypothetical protein
VRAGWLAGGRRAGRQNGAYLLTVPHRGDWVGGGGGRYASFSELPLRAERATRVGWVGGQRVNTCATSPSPRAPRPPHMAGGVTHSVSIPTHFRGPSRHWPHAERSRCTRATAVRHARMVASTPPVSEVRVGRVDVRGVATDAHADVARPKSRVRRHGASRCKHDDQAQTARTAAGAEVASESGNWASVGPTPKRFQ